MNQWAYIWFVVFVAVSTMFLVAIIDATPSLQGVRDHVLVLLKAI